MVLYFLDMRIIADTNKPYPERYGLFKSQNAFPASIDLTD
jgi:hypothetical protein